MKGGLSIAPSDTAGYQFIADATANGAANTISFLNIASGYDGYKVLIFLKPSAGSSFSVRFNNDSSAIYDYGQLLYSGAFAGISATNQTSISFSGSVNLGGSNYLPFILDINNKSSLEKGFIGKAMLDGAKPIIINGMWKNTASDITRIDMISSGNYQSGTYFVLYGLKRV